MACSSTNTLASSSIVVKETRLLHGGGCKHQVAQYVVSQQQQQQEQHSGSSHNDDGVSRSRRVKASVVLLQVLLLASTRMLRPSGGCWAWDWGSWKLVSTLGITWLLLQQQWVYEQQLHAVSNPVCPPCAASCWHRACCGRVRRGPLGS
jgi:hypothetical protein